MRGLLLILLALILIACGPPPPTEPLWQDEAEWVRGEQGWFHAVPLGSTRVLELAPDEERHFRVVAVPGQPIAGLNVMTDGHFQMTHLLDGPTPLDLDLAGTRHLQLSANGPIHLLRPRLSPADRQGRRMLLVVADTLRHDHATPRHMPRLSRWFAEGLRFERAFSTASWTLPSVASLFTGERPTRLRAPDGTLIALGAGSPTLARRLGERGWATAAVVANVTVNHENGFSQGFDAFHVPSPGGGGARRVEIGEAPDIRWLVERARDVESWWPDEDRFLYLQPMDPHDPYRPHDGGIALAAPHSGDELEPEALEALRSAYADEVEHLDHHLGELVEELGEVETVIFTSDHGEELFDHGGFRHGPTLYDEVVQVPLWIRGQGIRPGTVSAPASLVDLKRFLLERADGKTPNAATLIGQADSPVTVETFTFGPPRFSTVLGDRRYILFARPVELKEPGHAIEAWLRRTQPNLQVVDTSAVALSPDPVVAGDRSSTAPGRLEGLQVLRHLVEQYRGFRPAFHLYFEPGRPWHLRLEGVGDDGWCWGEGTVRAERKVGPDPAGPTVLELEVEAVEPFLLISLPQAEGAEIVVEDLAQGEPIEPRKGQEHPGLRYWFDPGRPPEELAGQAVTIERLKALGYL